MPGAAHDHGPFAPCDRKRRLGDRYARHPHALCQRHHRRHRHAVCRITELVPHCKFRDCSHSHEKGCAVQAAIQDGSLDPARLDRWRQLQAENRERTPSIPGRRATRRCARRSIELSAASPYIGVIGDALRMRRIRSPYASFFPQPRDIRGSGILPGSSRIGDQHGRRNKAKGYEPIPLPRSTDLGRDAKAILAKHGDDRKSADKEGRRVSL